MVAPLKAPGIDEIRAAQARLAGLAIKTPLIRLNYPKAQTEIYLKLENLQPVGAFKIRCVGNIIKSASTEQLANGVYTASSGNSGYTMSWLAQRLGIPATVYVPETAPETKCAAIRRVGATLKPLSFDDWWEILINHHAPGEAGMYVDAVCDPAAMPGNATIGLEILEDLPEVNTIIVPFGGGGVSCGIASTIRALKPDTRVLAAESETSTPFSSALQAGKVVPVECNPSFISGIGALSMLPEMWPLASSILDGSVVSPVAAIADAVRILFECNHVVAEGAGAASLAGALTTEADGPIVCVITGGNIDKRHMATILEGGIPA